VATTTPAVGVPAAGLSMFDPVFIGVDEFGNAVHVDIVFHNLLSGGEPGGGKSGLLNAVAAHGALSTDCRLVCLDGKQVELGMWRHVADEFIGPDLGKAVEVLRRLAQVMDNRYTWLLNRNRRKINRHDGMTVILTLIDEIALFSATLGTKAQQEEFSALLRDLVSRGRACGMPVVAATQRPSFDIIPTSLRDLFGYRAAFRCTTTNSSNIVLGQGWAEQGYTASAIAPTNQGEALLLAEGGYPRPVKVGYLSDTDILQIAARAARLRRA
jgi:S-DNA-T family DNA segregation ATPase FtsK/SpoIIIE